MLLATLWGASLGTARNVALLVALGFFVAAIASAWLIRRIASKVITLVLLGSLAVAAWSQRRALDDCASELGDTLRAGAVDDTTCTIFGRDVTVTARRGD